MKSKEEKILELFFNEPTREWRFEELVKEGKMARSKVNGWLDLFIKKGLIKKIKKRNQRPYYIGGYLSSEYKIRKKMFALNKLYRCGFLNHLYSLPKAKTIILFGSFSRSDWYKKSDIDVFIYGNPEGLKIVDYELKLHRDIQLFICQNKKELKKWGAGLLKNIVKGNVIKGNLDFIEVSVNA